MNQKSVLNRIRKSRAPARLRGDRRRRFTPECESLEGRQLLAAAIAVAGIEQHWNPFRIRDRRNRQCLVRFSDNSLADRSNGMAGSRYQAGWERLRSRRGLC